MTQVKEFLCEPKHLFIVIGTLISVIILLGIGKALAQFIEPALKKFFGKEEINISLGGGEVQSRKNKETCLINPGNCPAHQAEHERSLRNQKDIEGLSQLFHEFKGKFFQELDEVKKGNQTILLALVSAKVIRERDIPKDIDPFKGGG